MIAEFNNRSLLYIERKELNMADKETCMLLKEAEDRGVLLGIKLMQQRILIACENRTPISINGRGYWVQSDIDHLRQVMDLIN